MAVHYNATITIDDGSIRDLFCRCGCELSEEQVEEVVKRCASDDLSFEDDMFYRLEDAYWGFIDSVNGILGEWVKDVAEDLVGDEVAYL